MMKRILRCGLFLLLLLLPAVSVSAGEAGQIQVEVGAKGLMKFYDSSFKNFEFGYGSALAYCLFLVIAAASLVLFRVVNGKKKED